MFGAHVREDRVVIAMKRLRTSQTGTAPTCRTRVAPCSQLDGFSLGLTVIRGSHAKVYPTRQAPELVFMPAGRGRVELCRSSMSAMSKLQTDGHLGLADRQRA